MFWAWNFHVLNWWYKEQSVVILWVSWRTILGRKEVLIAKFDCITMPEVVASLSNIGILPMDLFTNIYILLMSPLIADAKANQSGRKLGLLAKTRQKLDWELWNWHVILMPATIWQILNMKWIQWPETEIMFTSV